ncbi:hypothetical protein Goarm_023154 [Gossypium armourianum]|uniref:Disease resistance protein winged helix domain-containing protein n=1 Tax=Gossypium armourianum TaxID=34283 RepID=A0A7J9KDV7_9ROSI|nr:hypothetical protein [Gossypium armourianum]
MVSTATMKRCLLYCCLYPEDYCIPKKRLVEYWFCEGLLNEFDRISKAQMQGDNIICSLLNACLLENGGEMRGEDWVKTYDVIRDMALWITREFETTENNFFVKAGPQLFEEPNVKTWKSVKRMSVMKNKIEVLKETPKCPNLRTLFLRENELQVISNGFFQFIPHLTVLDLSVNLRLRALPEGISQLVSLECLDLSYTATEELPIELKSLTRLKMLDLSYMNSLRKIPQHLISSFSKLFRCCTQALQLRDFSESEVFNVLCLENLEHLETLCFNNCENMEMKMEKLHAWVSSSFNYASCFHTLNKV